MGKYGEPWRVDVDDFGSKDITDCFDSVIEEEQFDRAIACVNAMEGRNPDGLHDAVRMLDIATTHLEAIEPASEFVRFLRADMRAALKKLGVIE